MSWRRHRPTPPPLDHSWTDRVDSVDANLAFTAHIHLTIRTKTAHPNGALERFPSNDGIPAGTPATVARAAIWARAQVEEVTQQWDVLHRHAAQHDLNDHLSRHLPHTMNDAVVGFVTAVLSVTADDTRAAHELQQARREAHLDDLARRQTATTLRFLREECFDNPASARLFLMLNTNARLGVFPSAEQADSIVAEVTRWHPETLWVQVAKTLQNTLESITVDQIDELLRVLSAVIHSTGHPSQARILENLRSDPNRCSRDGAHPKQ